MAVIEVHEKLVGKAAVHEMNERLNRAGFDVVSRVWDTYLFRNRNLVGPGV
jgi:hypothetical protein